MRQRARNRRAGRLRPLAFAPQLKRDPLGRCPHRDLSLPITLPQEARKQSLTSIRRYVAENFDQDIGDLKAIGLLDYFLKEIGPTVYNQAIADAQAYFQRARSRSRGRLFREGVHLLGAHASARQSDLSKQRPNMRLKLAGLSLLKESKCCALPGTNYRSTTRRAASTPPAA